MVIVLLLKHRALKKAPKRNTNRPKLLRSYDVLIELGSIKFINLFVNTKGALQHRTPFYI